MPADSIVLTPEELQQIEWGHALAKDYLHIITISYEYEDEWYETVYSDLLFDDNSAVTDTTYTNITRAGKTLWEAVREDLRTDFDYPPEKASFRIDGIASHGTNIDRDGRTLSMVQAVVIVNEKFNTDNLHPIGTRVYWGKEIHLGEEEPNYPVVPVLKIPSVPTSESTRGTD